MTKLTDGVVVLRPWRSGDAEWYAVQSKDQEIQQNTSEPPDLTAARVVEAIARYADDADHPGWAICAVDDDALLGNVAVDLVHGEVSYWVAVAARGGGVATRALRLVTAYAFRTSSLAELHLWVRAGNLASAGVATKAGYTRAYELDRKVDVKGELWAAEYYRVTR